MELDSYTLIFDDAKDMMPRNIDDNDVVFTEGMGDVITTYFRNGRESRSEILTLLGKAYENDYIGFLR